MFASVAALHAALLEKEPTDFVSHYLFEPIPFVFSNDLSSWIRWKTEFAKRIEVDPYDIVITGSGAVGYSLNPKKNYRAFGETSDIDCGVVSSHHFEVAWRYLRHQQPAWLSLPAVTKRAIHVHRKIYVFSGTIATDWFLGLLPFGGMWQTALDAMGRVSPTEGREVKLRIYKDYDSLRYYQASGIEQLRSSLAGADAKPETTEIGTEDL